MHFLSALCALTWALASVAEFIPRVTKSTVKGPQESDYYDYPDVARFGDSDTLILTFGNRLYISFDDGEHWETVNGIEGGDIEISIDQFHQERAFIITGSQGTEEIHVTEDKGKNWRKFLLPQDAEPDEMHCFPITHPFERKLILLNCHIMHETIDSFQMESIYFEGNIFYGSNDAGSSFRRIISSGPSDFRTTCTFAASEGSAVKDDGIYCIETTEKSEGSEVQFSNQRKIDSGAASFNEQRKSTGTLFYTTDFGKTKKTFNELNDISVEHIFVLPSCVAVITSDASDSRNTPSGIRISKNSSFKVANVPEGVLPWYVANLIGDDEGRLLLWGSVKDNDDPWRSMRSLVSDSSGLNFSFHEPVPYSNDDHIRYSRPMGNLKGHLWGRERVEKDHNEKKKGSWLQRLVGLLKNFFFENFNANIQAPAYVTKCSFDNGETWNKLKVVDPSGKHKRLFKCDINDVEHCSLQAFPLYTDEPTAGIIISRGIAGKNSLALWDDRMTFISRDGGVSWEVAFENSVETAILDFGNIIVAMPWEDSEWTKLYTKFYFSLDQGRTWKVYHFDEPIRTEDIDFNSRGLKAYIGFTRVSKESVEYTSYSIDFSNAFNGAPCTEGDLERWYSSEGNCIDAKRYSFDRRKPDAKCLARKTFQELKLHEEKCEQLWK